MPLGQPRVPMVPGRPYKYTGMAGATQVEHKVALCAESPKVLILVSKIGSVPLCVEGFFGLPVDPKIRLIFKILFRWLTAACARLVRRGERGSAQQSPCRWFTK